MCHILINEMKNKRAKNINFDFQKEKSKQNLKKLLNVVNDECNRNLKLKQKQKKKYENENEIKNRNLETQATQNEYEHTYVHNIIRNIIHSAEA